MAASSARRDAEAGGVAGATVELARADGGAPAAIARSRLAQPAGSVIAGCGPGGDERGDRGIGGLRRGPIVRPASVVKPLPFHQ